MPNSILQSGFAGITVRGVPLQQAYPGEVFWVNNSSVIPRGGIAGVDAGSASTGRPGTGSYKRPFATVDFAIGKTTAARGDIVMVMPGYTQSLASASAIDLDVAGTAIVGLGTGTLRPQLRFTAVAGLFDIAADDVAIIGFDFVAAFADVTKGLAIAANRGITIENCNFTEEASDENWLNMVILTTLAHDLQFNNCTFIGNDALNVAFVTGVVHDRLVFDNCRFYANTAQGSVTALIVGTAVTSGLIRKCSFRSNVDDAKFIGYSGACTGITRDCCFSSIDDAAATTAGYVASGHQSFNCYVSGEEDKWGILGGGDAIAA